MTRISPVKKVFANERGVALVAGLMILAVLIILGATAVVVSTTDTKIGSNYKTSVQAFYNAEAGVREALYRLSLVDDNTKAPPTGSMIAVNGLSGNNAYINIDPNGLLSNGSDDDGNGAIDDVGDLNYNGSYDNRNWKTKIMLATSEASYTDTNITIYTSSIQPSGSWLEYSSSTDDGTALTIEFKKDTQDIDGDSDRNEIVFYNTGLTNPYNVQSASSSASGQPVVVITSTGKSGGSEKKIQVEATADLFAIKAGAAMGVNNPPSFKGNSTMIGFNFKKETRPDFSGNTRTINELKERIGDPDLLLDHYGNKDDSNTTVEAGDSTIPVPYVVDGSGNWMLEDSGHLPGASSTGDAIALSGGNVVFGGNGSKAWKDEGIASWSPIQDVLFDPEVYTDPTERLSMLNDLLAKADITDADLETNDHLKEKEPVGVIYVEGDLELGNDTPTPASGYGQGLMYVKGNLRISGDFNFKGLVYVEGNAKITGQFWNLGVIMAKGTSVDIGGTATTLYSKGVLDDLEDYTKTKTLRILSWKEVF